MESGERVVAPRLQRLPVADLIGCQDDAMAMGAGKAVDDEAVHLALRGRRQ